MQVYNIDTNIGVCLSILSMDYTQRLVYTIITARERHRIRDEDTEPGAQNDRVS